MQYVCLHELGPTAVLLIKVSDVSRAMTSAKAATSLEHLQRRNKGGEEEVIMMLISGLL